MFTGGILVGKIFGISIRIHYSWFVVFLLVTWSLAGFYFPVNYPGWSRTTAVLAGLVTSILFFGSVLIHELAHSLVAKSEGIPVRSITLFIFGGVSQISQEPGRAGIELRMALAGPLTSFALGGVFWGILLLTGDGTGPVAGTAQLLRWINVLLAGFNLIPGFPLDGGRVLRAIVWWRTGDIRRSTKAASTIGRIFGYFFIFVGIWLIFSGNLVNGIWLALIGWFLENAAVGSYRQLALQQMLQGHTAKEVMTTECPAVQPGLTVEQLVNDQILPTGRRCFLVRGDGQVLGMITLNTVKEVPRGQWSSKRVEDTMVPFKALKWVSPEQDLFSVLQSLVENNINQVPVMENGRIVGMVARDSLLSYIQARSELGA